MARFATTLSHMTVKRVLLASPRGYCAGVERAVETVERALEHYGAPVYVRKQIVHNIHVVRDLEARGAIFVDEETDVPHGATVVYSAHGVAPSVHENSQALGHDVIDATCPLVTKVHVQAKRYAAAGYTVLLIGHEGHEEVVGTMGEAPGATVLVQDVGEAESLDLPADAPVAYVTQTTLSVDETAEIIGTLRRRFPAIVGPKKEDICYATSNRQWAVKDMLGEIDLLTRTSSMSEVADGPETRTMGRPPRAEGARRSTSSGTVSTTCSARTTQTCRSGTSVIARRPWPSAPSNAIVPVSAQAAAQVVTAPSIPSSATGERSSSSTTSTPAGRKTAGRSGATTTREAPSPASAADTAVRASRVRTTVAPVSSTRSTKSATTSAGARDPRSR